MREMSDLEAIYLKSGDRVTLPPRDNFIDSLYGKSSVIMMWGFTLKFTYGTDFL